MRRADRECVKSSTKYDNANPTKDDEIHQCMFKVPACKAGEVLGYVDKSKPICGVKCGGTGDAPCTGPDKDCVMNYKTDQATIGMVQARADELYMCMPAQK